jgi:hypothetical protein
MMKTQTATAANVSICAQYHATRFDLPEGRDWLVTGCNGHSYVVTIWVEEANGRMAKCQCKAFQFGNVCKHLRFIQTVDSLLTKAAVREIKPVYFN